MRHATLRAGLTLLVLLALPACSGDRAPGSDAVVSSADPAACPGEILDVVVSVGAWGGVVRRLAGDCATVTTIAPAGETPDGLAPADRTAFDDADLVVVNGARYDAWAADAASGAGAPVVLSAADVAGDEQQVGGPHLWYDPAVVPALAAAVADELGRLSPDAAPYFDAQHTAWTAELQPYLDTVAALRAEAAGRTFAATDGMFGRMAEAVGLDDVTPAGFLRAARAGGPSADDLASFEALLRSGEVDVLVQDGDAVDGIDDRLREAADDAGVPIVEVTASPADDDPFVEWQLAQLAELAEALDDE